MGQAGRGVFAVVAALLALMIGATAAVAGVDSDLGRAGKIRYFYDSEQVPANSAGSVEVACPGSTRVIGGGIETALFNSGGQIHATFPSSPKTWSTDLFNDTNAQVQAEGYAFCTKQKRVLESSLKTVPAGGVAGVKADCGPNKHVIGGGVVAESNIVEGSVAYDDGDKGAKPDDGWRARARNPGVAANLVAYATCRKGPVAYRAEDYSSNVADNAFGSLNCPTSHHLTGVGLLLEGAGENNISQLTPADGPDQDMVPDDIGIYEGVHTMAATGSAVVACVP